MNEGFISVLSKIMRRPSNFAKRWSGPLQAVGLPLELASNFIPVRQWQEDYFNSFDPTGRNAQTVQDIADIARWQGVGSWNPHEIFTGASPLDDMNLASQASMAYMAPDAYGGFPNVGPMGNPSQELMRDAITRARNERVAQRNRTQQYDIEQDNRRQLGELALNYASALNNAAREWKNARSEKGLKTTVEDMARFRSNYRKSSPPVKYREFIESNKDMFPNVQPYQIR
jgi:hypothetical protein